MSVTGAAANALGFLTIDLGTGVIFSIGSNLGLGCPSTAGGLSNSVGGVGVRAEG